MGLNFSGGLLRTDCASRHFRVIGAGRTVTFFSHEFELPWDDPDESKAKREDEFKIIAFRSGRSIVMEKLDPDKLVRDLRRDASSRSWFERAWIYDKEAITSDYALSRMALEETPDKIRLLSWPLAANWSLYLLMTKGILAQGARSIFFVSSPNLRGFQFGSPPDRQITLDLFTDKNHLKFIFKSRNGSPAVSQSEINRVIQTLGPAHQ